MQQVGASLCNIYQYLILLVWKYCTNLKEDDVPKFKKLTPYRAMLFLLWKLHQFQTIYFMKDKDIHYRPDKT